jgi:PEP-CTERM motif
MKTGIKSWQVGFLAGALLSLFVVTARAQNYSQPFNNADLNNGSSATGFQFNSRNFNPPPMGENFDYGGFTPSLTATTLYAPTTESTFTNTPNSGSMELSWSYDAADGGAAAAYTLDLLPFSSTPTQYTNLSFDMMVGVGSTPDTYGGYGYFQVFTRDESYNDNDTGYNQELANPGYGSPASPGPGVWQHISINLSGVDAIIRGVTFQDYADGVGTGRPITGPEFLYIDNITLTAPVPEPTSLALLGLAIPGFLIAARRNRKSA